MTSFTDDDLKRLKEVCDSMDGKFESWNYVEKDGASIKALLSRLEAGEELIGWDIHQTGYDIPFKAWRKAAGKP